MRVEVKIQINGPLILLSVKSFPLSGSTLTPFIAMWKGEHQYSSRSFGCRFSHQFTELHCPSPCQCRLWPRFLSLLPWPSAPDSTWIKQTLRFASVSYHPLLAMPGSSHIKKKPLRYCSALHSDIGIDASTDPSDVILNEVELIIMGSLTLFSLVTLVLV